MDVTYEVLEKKLKVVPKSRLPQVADFLDSMLDNEKNKAEEKKEALEAVSVFWNDEREIESVESYVRNMREELRF